MEFLKKNWLKLIAAIALFVGLILTFIRLLNVMALPKLAEGAGALVPLTAAQEAGLSSQIWVQVALLVFFVVATLALIFNMCGKDKLANWLLFGGAIVSLIVFIVAFVIGSPMLTQLSDAVATAKTALDAVPSVAPQAALDAATFGYKNALTAYQTQLFGNIINIVVFALLPLIYGTKKLFQLEKSN